MNIKPLTVGPIVGYTTRQTIRLWGRGTAPKDKMHCKVYAELRERDSDNIITTHFVKVRPEDDFTAVLDFDGLVQDTEYSYRMGYFFSDSSIDEEVDLSSLSGIAAIPLKTAKTASADNSDVSFVVGSCRRIKPGDPKPRGDRTFGSIVHQIDDGVSTDAILMIGDQIYADDLAELPAPQRLKGFWKLYRSAFSQPNIAELMSRVPTYMTLDDHEITNNWTMDRIDEGDRELFFDAMQAYLSYQFIHGPAFQRSDDPDDDDTPDPLYYSMDVGRASFFVCDTRTERFPSASQMISQEQMNALLRWLQPQTGKIKFIVTSVPFLPGFSASKDDKWDADAFKDQRNEVIEHIFNNNVKNVFCICGDVHVSGHCTLTAGNNKKPIIRQIVSSQFYWPWYVRLRPTGSSSEGEMMTLNGTQYFIEDLNIVTTKPNFSRITIEAGSLTVQVYGRKGKKLSSEKLYSLD